jgi:hypothetical protein
MGINWRYPLLLGIDRESHVKSLWLGWWLILWTEREFLGIHFQPGL